VLSVGVRVGVKVMVAVGSTNEVNVGKGVEDGRKVASTVLVKDISSVSSASVGN